MRTLRTRSSILLLLLASFILIQGGTTFANALPPGLENDASQWGKYADQGQVTGTIASTLSPTQDGNALQVAIKSGQSYAGLHAFRNLPANDTAQHFSLDLSFYYTNSQPVQALEFTMNKWANNQRWEWALQWQTIASSTTATAQTWRIWTGTGWQSLKIQQNLRINAWHILHLEGFIQNGQVQYQYFLSDDLMVNLSSYQFAPVDSPGDKLAVGVQLDGNSTETPYSVYFRQVNLRTQ